MAAQLSHRRVDWPWLQAVGHFCRSLLQPAATWGVTSHGRCQETMDHGQLCGTVVASALSSQPTFHWLHESQTHGQGQSNGQGKIFFQQPEYGWNGSGCDVYKPVTEWKSGVNTPIYLNQIPEVKPSSTADWRQPFLNVDPYLFDFCKILSVMSPWFHMTVFVLLFR